LDRFRWDGLVTMTDVWERSLDALRLNAEPEADGVPSLPETWIGTKQMSRGRSRSRFRRRGRRWPWGRGPAPRSRPRREAGNAYARRIVSRAAAGV
jgi:hypothetical protein